LTLVSSVMYEIALSVNLYANDIQQYLIISYINILYNILLLLYLDKTVLYISLQRSIVIIFGLMIVRMWLLFMLLVYYLLIFLVQIHGIENSPKLSDFRECHLFLIVFLYVKHLSESINNNNYQQIKYIYIDTLTRRVRC
jgi:hypothetical protein